MSRDLVALMHRLGPEFAARARRSDDEDLFVAENYVALKKHGVLRAGLPVELGGGGAEHRELGEMLRVLARHCASTALALSMHTHQAATAVWRWRRDPAPLETLLRNVASNNLILVSSGGSDWIAGSGKAERVEGGWRITARKIFASGVPVGDVLVTSAVWDDPESGPTVLHFPLPLKTDGVRYLARSGHARHGLPRYCHRRCVRPGHRDHSAPSPGQVASAIPCHLPASYSAHLLGLSWNRGGGARHRRRTRPQPPRWA
jgi:alkylation response protein AidB-like acyl-CoA dehydrogenase